MPVRIEPNAEPIPGYKLIERLGGGGFGEVWKAEAPGGLHKAIKFVYGDLHAADDTDGNRAEQELKALSRVKTVHHPYILSLERYDIINGQLLIVMELADRTLWDRFRECRGQGLPGIPRDELLGYMRETAEALDLMNQQYQLQHLDIKPQNLFLVFSHVKVADFGLVKDLGSMAAATVTGGVTPVYAAPETFDGWLSRFSDQYSLAIVYQELLTGQRPFAGSTVRQLVMQHLQGEPDLSLLPVGDRPAIARALSKNPDERFPTCLEFIQALHVAAAPKPAGARPPSTPQFPALPPADTPPDRMTSTPAEEGAVSALALTGFGNVPLAEEAPAIDEAPPARKKPNVLPPRPPHVLAESEEQGPQSLARTCLQRPRAADVAALEESAQHGIVQPALVVGLGKLGMETLVALRKHLSHEFGHPDALPHVRMLAIDIDPDTLQRAAHGDSRTILRNHETMLAKLHRPSHYLQMRDRDGKLLTDSWLNSKLIYRLPKQMNSASLRALGRLAFVDNYRTLFRRLETELLACAAQDTLHEMAQQTDLGIRSAVPRVYVVAGLGGTTGSGMFLDAAYLIRYLLRKHGYSRSEIVGLFYLPDASKDVTRGAVTHAYAALTELNHYATGQSVFTATYHTNDNQPARTLSEVGTPFQRCFFLTLPAPKTLTVAAEDTPQTVHLAGQFIYRDLATVLGKTLDAARAAAGNSTSASYQTFGLHRIVWPRKRLLGRAALRLCRRTVERWMSKDASALSQRITQWSQEQWEAHGLRPEALITRHLQECEKRLKQSPEKLIQEALLPLQKALVPAGPKGPGSATVSAAPVVGAFAALEKLLGIPEECRDNNLSAPEPPVIEKALVEASESIGNQCDQRLTELVVRLLEEPAFRLAGAEEALRQFVTVAEQSLRSQETLGKELQERAVALYLRIHALIESPSQNVTQSNTIWKFGFSRRTPTSKPNLGADLLDLIRLYAKTRFQSAVLQQVNRQYVGLRGHLSDQIREVGFCRQRLGELLGLLEDRPPKSLPKICKFEKMLLPQGCPTIEDAVAQIETQVSAEELVTFDKVIQGVIRLNYRALLNVCMGPSNIVRTLAPIMVQEAEKHLAQRVEGDSVAELWLAEKSDERAVRDALTLAYQQAAPDMDFKHEPPELTVAVLPAGESGELLRQQLRQVASAIEVAAVERGAEILLYREWHGLNLSDLDVFGPIAQALYQKRCAADPCSVHSREDISAWQPLVATP